MDAADTAPIEIKRRTGALRSKQVLDAAEQCVQRLGFHNASMAEIAAAAGMSVGHIYRYFPSKEAIIVAIVERDAAMIREEAEALEQTQGGIRGALLAHAERFIDRCANPERVALTFEVMAEAARNPRVAAVLREASGEVQARTLARVRRAWPHVPEAELQRQMQVFELILGGLAMKAIKTPGLDRETMTRLADDCISRMIGAG